MKGHSGLAGNEAANRRAKEEVYIGEREGDSDLVTPCGVRMEARKMSECKRKELKWSNKAVRGLTYLTTGKGPFRSWLQKMGRADSDKCVCGEIQDVEHVKRGCLVRAGVGEGAWGEEECEELYDFLHS